LARLPSKMVLQVPKKKPGRRGAIGASWVPFGGTGDGREPTTPHTYASGLL
jgi:hypothetical protein